MIVLDRGLRYDQLLAYVERNPSLSVLEIGVARCETTIRLMAYANLLGGRPRYVGVDLFDSMTDALFEQAMLTENKRPRSYGQTRSFLREILGPALAERILLVEGLSHEALCTLRVHGFRFDLIFLDGGHTYEVAQGDWQQAQHLLADGGTIVFDDYPNWGVGRVVDEIDRGQWNVRVLEKVDTFKNLQPDEGNSSPTRQFQLVEVIRR